MELYKGFQVNTSHDGKHNLFWYNIYQNDNFVQKGSDTLSGDKITNLNQALNEGKKTVDAWIRLNLV